MYFFLIFINNNNVYLLIDLDVNFVPYSAVANHSGVFL